MSSCSIILFRDNVAAEEVEFANSWQGAARIWTSLYDRYCKSGEYDSWMFDEDGKLWKLAKRRDIPTFERAVLTGTFDYASVERKHFAHFASHLREFVKAHPPVGDACHLSSWADVIDSCDAEAVGFHCTSVSENVWRSYDEDTDSEILYNLGDGEKHFEVYAYLAEHNAYQETLQP